MRWLLVYVLSAIPLLPKVFPVLVRFLVVYFPVIRVIILRVTVLNSALNLFGLLLLDFRIVLFGTVLEIFILITVFKASLGIYIGGIRLAPSRRIRIFT